MGAILEATMPATVPYSLPDFAPDGHANAPAIPPSPDTTVVVHGPSADSMGEETSYLTSYVHKIASLPVPHEREHPNRNRK
jgi:hypothetical protein